MKSLIYILSFFALLALVAPASFLRADVLELRNGQKIEGKVIGQTKFSVRIRTGSGVKVVAKSAIRRLVYGGTLAGDNKKAEQQKQAALQRQKQLEAARAAAAKRQAEAARKKQAAAAKKPVRKPPRRSRKAGPADWTSFLLPGRHQLRNRRERPGRYLAGGALFGFTALFALETRRMESVRRYNEADETINLLIFAGQGGQAVDVALSLQRDELAAGVNETIVLQNYTLGLLAAVYAYNAYDILTFAGGQALRLDLAPGRASLSFQFRF